MEKSPKPITSQHCTPSSKHFRIYQNAFSIFPHACHMPRPSLPRFDHYITLWQGVSIASIFITFENSWHFGRSTVGSHIKVTSKIYTKHLYLSRKFYDKTTGVWKISSNWPREYKVRSWPLLLYCNNTACMQQCSHPWTMLKLSV
jgi:hypothetical protein